MLPIIGTIGRRQRYFCFAGIRRLRKIVPVGTRMLVHFVTDKSSKIRAIRAVLEPRHHVVPQLLGAGATPSISNGVLMVDADLRKPAPVEQIKRVLRRACSVPEKLFVVEKHLHHSVAQALALGATAVVYRPNEIMLKLAEIEDVRGAAPDGPVESSSGIKPACGLDASPEISKGAAAFASMFSAIETGKPFMLADAENATATIISGIEKRGLAAWLDDVRRYHEGTFQHCLLVTGVAVGFALEIKFSPADVKRLGLAASLHDIGKARIPLSILDKPGRLDPVEEQIIRRHPAIGHDILKAIPTIGRDILEGVRHHHEYLDGSGYPDGLTAPQISDLVRLLTISDIYAALIERRSYRAPMSPQAAYEILCGMDGKLEGSLVKAFRNVALRT
jgi:putative nucleotidyltransferase with HDIG domain